MSSYFWMKTFNTFLGHELVKQGSIYWYSPSETKRSETVLVRMILWQHLAHQWNYPEKEKKGTHNFSFRLAAAKLFSRCCHSRRSCWRPLFAVWTAHRSCWASCGQLPQTSSQVEQLSRTLPAHKFPLLLEPQRQLAQKPHTFRSLSGN